MSCAFGMNCRMPAGSASVALLDTLSVKRVCVSSVQCCLPFLHRHAWITFKLSVCNPWSTLLVSVCEAWCSNLQSAPQDSKHLGGLDPAKVCTDNLRTIQRIAKLHRSLRVAQHGENKRCEHPLSHNNNNQNMFQIVFAMFGQF